jgi:hypothetical protein
VTHHSRLPPRIVVATPRPGDFCCVPISGSVGLAVEFWQWVDGDRFQPYDHTEVYVGQPDGAGPFGYTVSTYPDGRGRVALPCPASQLPGSLWSSGLVDLTPAQRDGIVAWALEHQNVGYSWADYAALVLHGLRIPAPGLREYIASTAHMICSQYVDACYSAVGVRLFPDDRWAGYVKPGDLADLLESRLAARSPDLLRGRG